MIRPRPILVIVSEYAHDKGCVLFNGKDTWFSRDKKRSVRFSEARDKEIIVWDTGTSTGYVSLPRNTKTEGDTNEHADRD